jgi:hypothetical protein
MNCGAFFRKPFSVIHDKKEGARKSLEVIENHYFFEKRDKIRFSKPINDLQ